MIVTVTLNPALDKTLRVPDFAVGQHARARLVELIPAGKGINVGRGLSRFGSCATACGLVGRSELEAYRRVLEQEGVDCALTPVEGTTRTNTTILDPVHGTTTHLREEGFTVCQKDVRRLTDALRKRLEQTDTAVRVVFAGSLPPGLGPEDFVHLLENCRETGARIIVDTSGSPLRQAVDSGTLDAVKPNLTELGQCLGRKAEEEECVEAARELLGCVDTVLLTLGERGAWLVREDAQIGAQCRLDPGKVENTVGCGDAFLAGWLEAIEEGKSPREALRWAVCAGAASARGKTTVDYSRGDVEELLDRCEDLQPTH
jgi:1-phosphofructokinase